MASAKFLEEALSTDVDESAVSAIVGSLENQLVTSTPTVSNQSGAATVINQNHVNSAISNGGTVPSQKHGGAAAITNGDSINVVTTADNNKVLTNNSVTGTIIAAPTNLHNASIVTTNYQTSTDASKANDGVKIVYTQSGQSMTSTGAIIANRVAFPPQSMANGTIGLSPLTQQTVLQTNTTNVPTLQTKQLVIKTSAAPGTATGLVTVPMNVTAAVPQLNNVVNVRPGVPTQPQKGQPARVVLSAPQLVGARPGAPQILGHLQSLQPGQQGHLLLKTENGQFQLLRVGPAPANLTSTPGAGHPVTFRMQTVPATATTTAATLPTAGVTQVSTVTTPTAQATTVQKPANDNTKEKCRKFLANLLELSSKEPKSVERNVRTLIQELIDMKVEPEDFCDRLEKLLNASPQPCLIGFLKKSLPLLRQSLVTKELTIDGIRPPPANVVYSVIGGTQSVQTHVRPGIATTQVRLVTTPGATVVRPNQVIPQRLVTPIRGAVQQTTRMMTTIRQPATSNVIVSNSQPPALHPVYPANRTGMNIVRQPVQVRPVQTNQIRQPMTIRTTTPVQIKGTMATSVKGPGTKPSVPSTGFAKPATKDKEKKSFSSAYTGDDDINDVAAMGGVNLAEETQRILGSTEFVGTQIRSCKEEFFLSMGTLQQKIRQVSNKHGLEEPNTDVSAIISHAVQERLKNLVEKLAIITEHRLEMVKSDTRYEVTNDIKGQLKFLEELDRAERKRHEEQEREILLRAAKSRSKSEDPEQAKLKAKAKEMQRVEMEELRQREANATALQAIGPRKKPRLDGDGSASSSQTNIAGVNGGARGQLPLRQRMKKVTLRDLQFLFETEKDLCKSTLLYKSYLK